jgi:hypothetical protein
MNRLSWVLSPLLIQGCYSPNPLAESTSGWLETGPVKRPRQEVVRETRDLVARQGYGILVCDEAKGWLETDWITQLSSHWREGYRTMVEVEFVPSPGAATNVRVRSRRQVNDEAGNPMSLEKARWISAGFDEKQKPKIPEPAMRIHQLLRFKLLGLQND